MNDVETVAKLRWGQVSNNCWQVQGDRRVSAFLNYSKKNWVLKFGAPVQLKEKLHTTNLDGAKLRAQQIITDHFDTPIEWRD